MRAINHAMTGTAIGLVSGRPEVALPLAFVSHFICDVIPHYGNKQNEQEELKSKSFTNLLIIDTLLCIVLVAILVVYMPKYWLLAAVCAFVAAVPDFFSMPRYLRAKRGQNSKVQKNLYTRFASKIQWYERPKGAFVEIAWFIAMLIIITPYF